MTVIAKKNAEKKTSLNAGGRQEVELTLIKLSQI
jgi:hypothetical protein